MRWTRASWYKSPNPRQHVVQNGLPYEKPLTPRQRLLRMSDEEREANVRMPYVRFLDPSRPKPENRP